MPPADCDKVMFTYCNVGKLHEKHTQKHSEQIKGGPRVTGVTLCIEILAMLLAWRPGFQS